MKNECYVDNFKLREATPHRDSDFELNRLSENLKHLNLDLKRYIIDMKIMYKEDLDIPVEDRLSIDFSIGFSVPKKTKKPLEYFIDVLKKTYNSTLNTEENSYFYGEHSLKTDFNDISFEEVGKFLENFLPKKHSKTFKVEDFHILDDYKYLFYSNCKWIDTILHLDNNISLFNNFEGLIEELEKQSNLLYKNNKKTSLKHST